MISRAGAGVALALIAGCSQPAPDPSGPPVVASTTVFSERTVVQAPSGSISLRFENGTATLSAGFMRQSPVATVESPSTVSWAPDSRRFFINESGGASGSRFRLWEVDARAQATEVLTLHAAAAAELGRVSGCPQIPPSEVATTGMGWSADGSLIHVLTEVRGPEGACNGRDAMSVAVVLEAATGRVVEATPEAEARRRYPTLPWRP